MTETRIRWEPDGHDGFTGHAGTLETKLFEVWQSPCDGGNYALGEWLLTTSLPVTCNRTPHSRDPDELKAEAERWLAEFVTSLGASFEAEDDDDSAEWDDMEYEEAFRARNAPGRRVRYTHPDHGYPADQEMAADLLTPGGIYVIAWSDIGFSSTRLGLAGIESRGQGFNSVLFESVDDAEPVPPHPEEEATR